MTTCAPLWQDRFQRQVAVHQSKSWLLAHSVGDVIADDGGAFQVVPPQLVADLQRGLGGARRISRAHVGHQPNALVPAGGQKGAHALLQHRVIAVSPIVPARKCFARDGSLGQALAHQIVDIAAFQQWHGGADAVIGHAGANADA
ncbi:hypothetical protein G6F50_015798 [Rhizopus delemar]|uniref:Uncharacterized protein n=1 Tax=Rhizopus delemar TaxID=936053 RepID=A0A9P7C369_9FUNG|nr:hypothetical protein G6F50_015798 [Rhizopus delemar]